MTELSLRNCCIDEEIAKSVEYIKTNFVRDIRIEELARLCNMSEGNFSRRFKKAMGQTPHSYILKLRIERASSLLREGKYDLPSVAEKSGFYDENHLIRHFKREMGTTPSKYRQSGMIKIAPKKQY